MTVNIDFEKIAAQIHQFYEKKYSSGLPKCFEDLSEFMKADNRAAAKRIGQVLSLAGLRIVPRNGKPWTPAEQTEMRELIEQNIVLLAEGEHDGWTETRLRDGWRLGDCKILEKREHHLLVPYALFRAQVEKKQKTVGAANKKDKDGNKVPMTLEEEVGEEQEKDRDSVRNYVQIIAETEYRIAREGRHE